MGQRTINGICSLSKRESREGRNSDYDSSKLSKSNQVIPRNEF